MTQSYVQERLPFEPEGRGPDSLEEIRAPGLTAEQDRELDQLLDTGGLSYAEALQQLGLTAVERPVQIPAGEPGAAQTSATSSETAYRDFDRLDDSGLDPRIIRARAGLN